MDTSRPSAARAAPLRVRIAVRAAATQARPAGVSHRAGLTTTGRSRPTYIRWCFSVPVSRDRCPGLSGINRPELGGVVPGGSHRGFVEAPEAVEPGQTALTARIRKLTSWAA